MTTDIVVPVAIGIASTAVVAALAWMAFDYRMKRKDIAVTATTAIATSVTVALGGLAVSLATAIAVILGWLAVDYWRGT